MTLLEMKNPHQQKPVVEQKASQSGGQELLRLTTEREGRFRNPVRELVFYSRTPFKRTVFYA